MSRQRLACVDNLRLALVVLVIAHHAVEPYASKLARWTVLPDEPVPGLWSFLWVNAAFFMGLFFLVSGLFTPISYDRKGPEAFGRDRAIRLGIPLAFGLLLLIPLQGWLHHCMYSICLRSATGTTSRARSSGWRRAPTGGRRVTAFSISSWAISGSWSTCGSTRGSIGCGAPSRARPRPTRRRGPLRGISRSPATR